MLVQIVRSYLTPTCSCIYSIYQYILSIKIPSVIHKSNHLRSFGIWWYNGYISKLARTSSVTTAASTKVKTFPQRFGLDNFTGEKVMINQFEFIRISRNQLRFTTPNGVGNLVTGNAQVQAQVFESIRQDEIKTPSTLAISMFASRPNSLCQWSLNGCDFLPGSGSYVEGISRTRWEDSHVV